MLRRSEGSTETLYIVAVALPPLLLIGCFIGDYHLRSRGKHLVVMQVESLSSRVKGTGRSPERFDERVASAMPSDWFAIARSTERFSAGLQREVTDGEKLVPPGKKWQAAPLAEKLVEEERPLLERLTEMLCNEGTPKSAPKPLANHRLQRPDQSPVPIDAMLHRAFRVAYHQGDTAQCLKLLRQIPKAYSQSVHTKAVVTATRHSVYPTLRTSLQYNVWNEDQLEELREFVEPLGNVQADWTNGVVSNLGHALDDMHLDGHTRHDGRLQHGNVEQSTFETDPRHILYVLQYYENLLRTPNAGTKHHVKQVHEIERNQNRNELTGLSLTSMPFAVAHDSLSIARRNRNHFAASLLETVLKHKLTVAAIAVRQYQAKTGNMPKQITDLRQVGLTPEDWRLFDNETLLIKTSRDSLELSTVEWRNWTARMGFENTRFPEVAEQRESLEMWSGTE